MEHLTKTEILRFAALRSVDAEGVAIVERVNRHILECPECANAVKRATAYHDVLEAMSEPDFSLSGNFSSIYDISPEEIAKEARLAEEELGAYNVG